MTDSQDGDGDRARVLVSARIRRAGRDLIDRLAKQEHRTRSQMIGILLAEAVAARRRRSRDR